MKARELLEEIKENIKDYDIEPFEERLRDGNTDQTSKLRANFHIQNYNEIMELNINEDDDRNIEIDDKLVNDIKDELGRFFEGCSPESEEGFKKFIIYTGSCDIIKECRRLGKSRKPLLTKAFGAGPGTHRRTRTSDLPLRRRPLYPTELCGHILY